MNKTDVFFISASMFGAWVCFIFMAPPIVVFSAYAVLANMYIGFKIGDFIGNKLLLSDKALLKMQNKILNDQQSLIRAQRDLIDSLNNDNENLNSIIDRLMFEYCPEEMSPSQIANYEAHVKATSKEQEDEINQALKH